jgi:hypothetical protein
LVDTEQDGLTQSLWRAAQRACQAGAISQAELEGWMAGLHGQMDDGEFLASITYFIIRGDVTI